MALGSFVGLCRHHRQGWCLAHSLSWPSLASCSPPGKLRQVELKSFLNVFGGGGWKGVGVKVGVGRGRSQPCGLTERKWERPGCLLWGRAVIRGGHPWSPILFLPFAPLRSSSFIFRPRKGLITVQRVSRRLGSNVLLRSSDIQNQTRALER